MDRTRTAGIALAAACAAVLVTGCGHAGREGSGATGRAWTDGTSAVPRAPGPRLVVDTQDGVRLRPAADGAVHIRASTGQHVDSRWSAGRGTAVLDLRCPAGGAPCDRTPTVEVPDGTSVTVSARNAGIDAAGLRGRLDLTTVGGDVTATAAGDPSSPVRLATRNGSVRATALRSSGLTAETVNGDVVLACDEAPDSVRASTTNGSVDVTVPHDAPAYVVGARTRNGQEHIDLPRGVGPRPTLTLSTVNGDVTARSAG